MLLKQNRLFDFKQFEIVEDGVKLISKSPGNYSEQVVPFERIGSKISLKREGKYIWQYLTVFSLLLIIFNAYEVLVVNSVFGSLRMPLALSAVSVFVYFFTRKNYILLTGNSTDIIFLNKELLNNLYPSCSI